MEKKVLSNVQIVEKVNDSEIYETYEQMNIVKKIPDELYCYHCKRKTDVVKNGLIKRIKNKLLKNHNNVICKECGKKFYITKINVSNKNESTNLKIKLKKMMFKIKSVFMQQNV